MKTMIASVMTILTLMASCQCDAADWIEYIENGYAWEYMQVSIDGFDGLSVQLRLKKAETNEVVVPSAINGIPVRRVNDLVNDGVNSIIVPDGVGIISGNGGGGRSIDKIMFPSSIYEIQPGMFKACTNVKDVTWPGTIKLYDPHLVNGNVKSLPVVSGITNIVVAIGTSNIISSCFADCINAENITIPEGVTNISSLAFARCSSLSHVNLPANLMTLEQSAFAGCQALRQVTIPASVHEIGGGTFSACYNLTNVTLLGDAPFCDAPLFENANRDLIVYVPVGSKGWDGNPESTALPKYWPYNTEGGRRIVHIGETVNDGPSVITNYVYSTVTNYIHTTVTNEVFHYSTVTNEVHHHTTDEIHHYSTVTNEVFHYMTVTNELFHYSTVTNEIQNYMTVTNELHHYETVTNEVQNHSTVTNVMHVYSTVTNVVEYVPEPGTSPDAGYTIRAGEEVVLTIVGAAGWDAFGIPDGMTWNRTTGKLSGCVRRSGIYDLLLLSGSGVDTRIMRTTITVTGGAGEEDDGDPLLEPIKIVGGDLANGTMVFSMDMDTLPDFGNGLVVIKQALPTNVLFKVTGGKKLDAGKAALLKYQKVKLNGTERYVLVGLDDASRPNVSGIKLMYTPKTGVLKGSFNVYASDAASTVGKPKLVKYKAVITGTVVNGVGIGQVTMTKPVAGPWGMELR